MLHLIFCFWVENLVLEVLLDAKVGNVNGTKKKKTLVKKKVTFLTTFCQKRGL